MSPLGLLLNYLKGCLGIHRETGDSGVEGSW